MNIYLYQESPHPNAGSKWKLRETIHGFAFVSVADDRFYLGGPFDSPNNAIIEALEAGASFSPIAKAEGRES